MAYSDVAQLEQDQDFRMRTMACAATESVDNPPAFWADHSWGMAAMPGFGDKYASGIANGIERPGNDPAVITDGDILSAVQSLNTGT